VRRAAHEARDAPPDQRRRCGVAEERDAPVELAHRVVHRRVTPAERGVLALAAELMERMDEPP
jgi:hypothetical protein